MEVSTAGLLALAASARFDHHTAPPNPASSTAAINKRTGFISAYLPKR